MARDIERRSRPRQQLTLGVERADVAKAEALLTLAGAESIALTDDGAQPPVLEPAPGTTPLWPSAVVTALFPADQDLVRLASLLGRSLRCKGPARVEPLDENRWRASMQTWPPTHRVGRRLVLTNVTPAATDAADTVVKLNFGLGFGTGEHPTTALCLEWLEEHVEPGARVLDYGCGSGVLAVTALVLGARRAWATDIEPLALAATASNAALNGLRQRIWVGLPHTLPAVEADVIVANILAEPLIALAERFSRYLARHGDIVLSGLLEAERGRVEAAFRPHFSRFEQATRDGWTRLVASR